MAKITSMDRVQNSPAGSLLWPQRAAKFRCRGLGQIRSILLIYLRFSVVMEAFGGLKSVFSLRSGRRPLFSRAGGPVKYTPRAFRLRGSVTRPPRRSG